MRKYLFSALALGLVMTSCQSDEPFAPGSGEEVQASFTISVPDAMGTRAADHSSAEGGFTNRAGNLNYTVVLLNDANKVMYSATSTGNGTSATFNPTVVRNYQYKILAYATFGDAAIAAPTVGQTIADTDAINNIATLKGINDESEDAYFCNATIVGAPEMEATLKRPFGKLRLVATDYDKLCDLGLDVKSVKVTYGTTVVMEETFDAFNKAFEGDGDNVWSADKATYAEAAANELTVFTDYLPALTEGEKMYPFTIEVTYNDNKTVYTRTFAQDIPVKRNYLTTLRGNFFTTEAALTLEVEEMFANEDPILDTQYTYFTVDTNDELKAALTSNYEHIYVELDANLAVDVNAWETLAFGGDKTKSITINGEQVVTRSEATVPTLTFNHLNGDWNNIVTKNGAKLILKNLNVTNSGKNNGPWNRHDLNFACDVEMENVVSDKAIALKAGGVLKNVTIDDANGSDTYALWIQPNGQVVTLDGCTIDMLDCTDGRGIKIDEQYVDEVKAPTLNVSGTTFKTEEKAAVIVKSKDGAIINWGEGNDISEVAADSEFPVWVDEASAAYADKVIVNGAVKIVEGATPVEVATVDELNEKLADANVQNIYLADGVTFEGTFSINSNKNIISNPLNKATLKGRVEVRSCNPTFENVKFDRNETDSNNAMQTASNALQYKAVVMIYGDQTNKVTFKKCDFYNNNGTHKSAITNTAVELIVDECYFEGRSSSIYSQCNLSVTNSTFNYTGGNNVIASINGCGETGGKFIFKNNNIAGEKIFALTQFLSTVGFGNGKYFFDVQNNTGAGFDYYFLNEGRVPNAEFANGSERF